MLAADAPFELEVERPRVGRMRVSGRLASRSPLTPSDATTWDARTEAELVKLANALNLRDDQRLAVKMTIIEGQAELNKRLAELLMKPDGVRSTNYTKIHEECSARTRARIEAILDPEQQQLFAEFLKKKGL